MIADPAPGISAVPHEDNLRYFDVVIEGPSGSPFEGEAASEEWQRSARLSSGLMVVRVGGTGGKFKLELFLPGEYPMTPPKVRFLTKIYHPNIGIFAFSCVYIYQLSTIDSYFQTNLAGFAWTFSKVGRHIIDPRRHADRRVIDKWSPALQIRTVLLSIQALLSAPNPDDPLATDVAKHYKTDEKDAQRVSREWTQQYGEYVLPIPQGVITHFDSFVQPSRLRGSGVAGRRLSRNGISQSIVVLFTSQNL